MNYLYDKKNEITYFKWGIIAGSIFILTRVIFNKVMTSINLEFIANAFTTELVFNVIYLIMIYSLLKTLDSKIKNINKLSIVLYVLAGILLTNTIIISIIAKSFKFDTIGLIPILITFITPVIYKIKNK